MPMIAGSTPVDANDRIFASGFRPSFAARSAVATTTAAAPSLMPDALPAVTVPSFLKAGFNAGQLFGRRAGARIFVGVERDRIALLLRNLHRNDLVA